MIEVAIITMAIGITEDIVRVFIRGEEEAIRIAVIPQKGDSNS
jgi:hypothetical protein